MNERLQAGTLDVVQNEYGYNGSNLDLAWQWNHNPNNNLWSLTEREGFLRLKSGLLTEHIQQARNILTQRTFGPFCSANTAIEICNMNNGDVAGLSAFQNQYGFIGVRMENGQTYLVMHRAQQKDDKTGTEIARMPLTQERVYLRVDVDGTNKTDKAYFLYSLDGETWIRMGDVLQMAYDWPHFVGYRFGLFYYSTENLGGCVDFDYLRIETDPPTPEDSSTSELKALTTNIDQAQVLRGSSSLFAVMAEFANGHFNDVTTAATYSYSQEGIVEIADSRIKGLKDGTVTIGVSYKDAFGTVKTTEMNVTVETFPLTNAGGFNPSFWGDGTFDENTLTLTTGQYGFAGWQYGKGIDLSDYKYIVVELAEPTTSGASFRLFDENSYWTIPASYDFDAQTTKIVVDVNNMTKEVDGSMVKCDPSHLYIIGFWSFGNAPIKISRIFLSDDGQVPTSAISVISDLDENNLFDVYTIMGTRVRSQITKSRAVEELPTGMYIIGNEKVYIRK